jgi:hypothetical protein
MLFVFVSISLRRLIVCVCEHLSSGLVRVGVRFIVTAATCSRRSHCTDSYCCATIFSVSLTMYPHFRMKQTAFNERPEEVIK